MPIKKCKWCKEKHEFCDSCGIGIGGLKHKEEHYASNVGEYVLCSRCYSNLVKSRRVEIDSKVKGNQTLKVWLNKDGSTTKKQFKGMKK